MKTIYDNYLKSRFTRASILICLFFLVAFQVSAQDWSAKWIWQQEDGPANSWVSFRKTIALNDVPSQAVALMAVDSRFWLWVNGEMVVFEGGSNRGPSQAGEWDRDNNITPTNTWYEEVDISSYLKPGENTVAVLVWYWGRETHKGTYIDSKHGGLLFQCDLGEKTLVSDASWKIKQHPGYALNSGDNGTSVVQYNVKYDAQNDLNDWSPSAWYNPVYDDKDWATAIEKAEVGEAPWYNLEKNYVPRLINHGLKDYANNAALNFPFTSNGNVIECILPFNMQVTPYFEIESEAGKVITITTDNRLNKISANYTTKGGYQIFECFSWMNGHKILYTIPAGVMVKALKYRWMSVGEMVGSFETNDNFYERLWWMGRNTLFVCARDNFMDCPDRERALWIGDVADQTGYLFYSMDNAGRQLLKKAILNTMYFSEDKVIGALGPRRVRELPSQSMQFIAQTVWPYYLNTGDTATLRDAYPYVHDYLALWKMEANGLPEYRKWQSPDNWDWYDWGEEGTIDKNPIHFALYYMAISSAKKIAEELGELEHIAWYNNRMASIETAYDREYWKNGFYSSNAAEFKDDRANALAILSGLASADKYEEIVSNVLVPNYYCSPHFEWMVEAAMCVAGKYTESLSRMKSRYQSQVNTSGQSTLYESFPRGGSYNHAWNASNTVLSQYIAGIEPTKPGWSEFKVCPNLVHLKSIKHLVPSVKGDIQVEINSTPTLFNLKLVSPDQTLAIVGIPKSDGTINKIKVGTTTIWEDGAFIEGLTGISYNSEDADFIKLNVLPGTWDIVAERETAPSNQSPYKGSTTKIPGTLEVENYDEGGQGVSYHDTDAGNTGNIYRTDDVDVGSFANGLYNIGWTTNDEWLEYTIDVAHTDVYDIDIVYAAGRPNNTAKIGAEFFEEGITLFSDLALPNTNNWDTYTTLKKKMYH